MTSSALPLSLLAKGIGQTVTNGHEKLEVYLEPEDYYNLKSYSPYHFAALQNGRPLDVADAYVKPIPLRKTFVTRKGALLIFSEELANKAFAEEARKHNLKRDATKTFFKHAEVASDSRNVEGEVSAEDPLRTVHDLRVAILMYGNRPDYRQKGDDLYLRFIHEAKAPKDERRIRPGFSPKRYITAWSKHWHDEMLQKLRSTGLVQDKTLYRQNPLLPHLYQPASYNLSAIPPPYRVTRNMLKAGNFGSYQYLRTPRSLPIVDTKNDVKDKETPKSEVRREPLPSTNSDIMKEGQHEPIPVGSIQAVRFLESGEVQEVKYSELKPQEKQEILADLLATAWEHGKHIEEMLDLVLASNKPRTTSAASSSAASELMMDMHRAILSLAESPIQRQIHEKQQQVNLENEKRAKEDRERAKRERKNQRKKRRAEREAQATKAEKQKEKRAAVEQEQQRKIDELARVEEQRRHIKLEEQQAELEEKEKRRQARREARKKKEEEKQLRKIEKEEILRQKEERERQLQEEEVKYQLEEKGQREERREDRRRAREERKRQKVEKQTQQARAEAEKQFHKRREEKASQELASKDSRIDQVAHENMPVEIKDNVPVRDAEFDDAAFPQAAQHSSHAKADVRSESSKSQNQELGIPMSRPMPSVPQNTPATQQRTDRVQRQLPLENVIYEAKSKRSHSSSSTISSSKSKERRTGTVVSSGDGEFATYFQPTQHVTTRCVVKKSERKVLRKISPQQRFSTQEVDPATSDISAISSRKNIFVFPAELSGDAKSSSGKSSFYGGAMPITSNIVKHTLSDKISILSAGQAYGESSHRQSLSDRSVKLISSDQNVPVIGVEPPTPIHTESAMGKQQYHSTHIRPSAHSASTRSGKLIEVSEKYSSTELSNESEDDQYLSDQSSHPKVVSQKSEKAGIIFTTKSSAVLSASGDSTSDMKYQVLKGVKGPGSQSSAATLSHQTGSKKSSSSVTRGSLPHALLKHKQAAVFMPDKQIVDVSAKGDTSSTQDKSTVAETEVNSSTVQSISRKLSIKSSLKDVSKSSSTKSNRRISFQEDEEDESSDEEEEESETEEEPGWPQAAQDLRPISSRSAKLTEHAQKVAHVVVTSQRPDSKLEEDASEAVKLWNKVASKSEDASSSDEESIESSEDEDDEPESSIGWNAEQIKEEDIVKKEKEEELKAEVEKMKIVMNKEKTPQTEIMPQKQDPAKAPSMKSYRSSTSGQTSISSIQEAFVKEVKRKASELGIDETELQFEPELVNKVYNSTVEPGEVEVFHDVESGKHVVRSRHSSITTKSYQTDNTDTTEGDEATEDKEFKVKHKYVIDMPLKGVARSSASPQQSVSTVSSATVSPSSPSRFRALSQASGHSMEKKSSVLVEKAVALEYELTSYEGKLGDPKPEEPTLVTRAKVEPEKLEKSKVERRESKADKKIRKETAEKSKTKSKLAKQREVQDADIKTVHANVAPGSVRSGASIEKEGKKTVDGSTKKSDKKRKETVATKKQPDTLPATVAPSPTKPRVKTPEVPFVAGRAKDDKVPKGLQSPAASTTPKPKKGQKKDAESPTKTREVESPTKPVLRTQVEMEDKTLKRKVSHKEITAKREIEIEPQEKLETKSKTSVGEVKESQPPSTAEEEDDFDQLSPIPAQSPEDDYTFVRVEETPIQSEPEHIEEEPVVEPLHEDAKSLASDKTAPTEVTENTDDTEERLRATEEEEAKLAKKKEKEERRLAAAEKRRLEVERKRKEKEEQVKKEKEEQERQEALKEELENERKRRAEELQKKRQDAERERLREQEEEELRRKRAEQQQERERRLQEEHKKKMEELQRKKREEEARKAELARIKAEEEAQARKEEEELMAQMAEDERLEYEKRKKEEAEAKRIIEEERRLREEEQARIAMEHARLQAIIRTKQQAALEEKLKFAREFFIEANGMDQTQNVNRAFSFSYFELLEMLGIADIVDINID